MKNKIKKIITIDNREIDLSHFNLDEEQVNVSISVIKMNTVVAVF